MRVYLAFTVLRLLRNHAHIVAKSETLTSTSFAAFAGQLRLLAAALGRLRLLAMALGRRVVEAPLAAVNAPLAAVETPLAAASISSVTLTRQTDFGIYLSLYPTKEECTAN